jgi:cysteine desulfurase/selenocysteine lyase
MTSSNGNGDGHGSDSKGGRLPPHGHAGSPRLDGFFPPQPTSPPKTGGDFDGLSTVGPFSQPLEAVPSVSGLELPAELSAQHFLDPAFLTGVANELYAEGLPFVSATDGMQMVRQAPSLPIKPPDLPMSETAPMRSVRGEPVNWEDSCLLMLTAESQMPAPAPVLPEVPAMPPMPGGESFYFLQHLTPAAAPLEPFPSKVPPVPEMPTPDAGAAYYFLGQPAVPTGPAAPASPLAPRAFNVESVRRDFPILHQTVHGKPLIWLDNAATTQKPRQVIDAVSRFYERDNSNIHRAAHTLAARATNAFEEARDKVRRFLGASQVEEIIFVRGCTEGINLVAQSYGRKFIQEGDEIVLTTLEHHSNIVPWHQLAKEKGAVLKVVPVNDRGEILLDEYERLLGPRTKFVSVTHVSNALGTVLPVRTMTQLAHRHGAKVLVDGAQSVPHLAVDVQALDCDFYIFSGHKLFAPTGIGAVYGKREVLEAMPPWQGGGNMIDQVTFEEVTYQPAPAKFEAGTGILAGAVGLGAAIDYIEALGMENISRHEHDLLVYATEGLTRIPGLRMIGTAAEKASVLSFVLDGVRTEDMGRYLDREGIAVRAGHHCAQPALRRFGLASTVRPSLAFYNTPAEVDALVAAVRRAKDVI